MTDVIVTEWTKLRTVATTWWLLAGTVAVTVLASLGIALNTHLSASDAGLPDPTKLALIGVDLGQAVVAVLAVLTVTEEYGTGMIRVTLAATPRRELTLAAKAVTVLVLTAIAAAPAIAGCLLAGRLLLPSSGLTAPHGGALISLDSLVTVRAAAGSIIYLGLIALLSLGIATVVRDGAASTGIVLGLLYLPPLLAQLLSGPWRRHIQQLAPMTAGLAIQATRHLRALPLSPWAGLGVLAVWAAAALAVGAAVLRTRDA